MHPPLDVRDLVEDALWSVHRDGAAEVLRDDDRARSAMTGVDDPGWNGVLRAVPAPGQSADDLVHELLAPYVTTATPMIWHVTADADPELEAALGRAGLTPVEPEPVMVLELDGRGADAPRPHAPEPDAPEPDVPPGVAVQEVTDLVGLRTWMCVLLGIDPRADAVVPERVRPRLGALVAARAGVALPGGDQHAPHLLATADGLPVGCVAAFTTGPALVVDHVVTARTWRGRGIGSLLTRAAVSVGREHGHRQAVLVTSPDGAALAGRLGFVAVGEVRRYCWSPGRRAAVV